MVAMATRDEFLDQNRQQPEAGWSLLQQALWWAVRGDWDQSHDLVNSCPDADGARLHANLHREEGDLGNADYWYRRAKAKRPECSWQEERQQLIEEWI